MGIRYLHSSDWQIGKVFRIVDDATAGLLQEARLKAITCLGELAHKYSVRNVLVAGDVYDMEALSPRSLNQPLERMRSFTGGRWHLLPGNHDPHRPKRALGSNSQQRSSQQRTRPPCGGAGDPSERTCGSIASTFAVPAHATGSYGLYGRCRVCNRLDPNWLGPRDRDRIRLR